MSARTEYSWRIWLLPLSVLAGLGLTVFVITLWVDASAAMDPRRALLLILHPNPDSAAATLSNAAEVVASVLAIAITVVAIVVELSANRYTHRITELFVSEPINFAVMGLFVITALQAVWFSLVFDSAENFQHFIPYAGITVTMLLLTTCLLILLPYFAFVFAFLDPLRIVERIRLHSLRAINRKPGKNIPSRQSEAVRGIEQLTDVALNAMQHKDKRISMASIDALKDLVIDYQVSRHRLSNMWFIVEGDLAHNPDFVSLAPHMVADVSARRIWLEMKVLRQYQTLFNNGLVVMRDINYLVAINTRLIAEHAVREGHMELVDLCMRFFNTYIRATINKPDVRTAYNVINQYRLLAESLLRSGDNARAVEIARYFKYYGQTSFNHQLPFVLETVAYDLCTLNELAFDLKAAACDSLLRTLLEVDSESDTKVQEVSLRGVRKAQVKLATYFLLRGETALARQVYEDMSAEPRERLASIRDELMRADTSEFWEVSDRGVNFDYLTPERRDRLPEYFTWFGELRPPRQTIALRMIDNTALPAKPKPIL